MLCITRRVGETANVYVDGVFVGSVMVTEVRSDGKVRLGFSGDRVRFGILRSELDSECHAPGIGVRGAELPNPS